MRQLLAEGAAFARLKLAASHVGTGQCSQCVCGFNQCVLSHLAYAGFDFHHKDLQHEKGGQPVDQEEGEKQAQTQAHGAYSGKLRL